MTTNSAWRDTIRPTRRDIDHEKERLRALIVAYWEITDE